MGQDEIALAVFAMVRGDNLSAEHLGHQLGAIADAEHRYAKLKDFRITARSVFGSDAGGASGEDNALVIASPDAVHRDAVGQDFAVDVVFAHAAGDQLVVLTAEIKDEDGFVVHGGSLAVDDFFATWAIGDVFDREAEFFFDEQDIVLRFPGQLVKLGDAADRHFPALEGL